MNYFEPSVKKQVFIFDFPGPGPVYLVGDFNDWQASEVYQMHRFRGKWRLAINLPPGHYRYGYEVRNCIFEDTDSHHLQRIQGWPRSCVECAVSLYCKGTPKNSNQTISYEQGIGL